MKTLYLVIATIGYCIEWKRWDFWNVYRLLKRCLLYLAKIQKISVRYIAKECHWDSHPLICMYRDSLRARIQGSGN